MSMNVAEIIAYTTFVTAGLTVAYVVLLAVEVKKGKRVAEQFRHYLDEKTVMLLKKVGKSVGVVSDIYERGSDEVEKDLIDPVAKPILKTQHKYVVLKTGERKIRRAGVSKISPHLQKLLKRNKKASKSQVARFRRKLKKLQQEVQQEQHKKSRTDNAGKKDEKEVAENVF